MFAGKSCREMFVGNVCRNCLQELFAGNSCGKFLLKILAEKSCGTGRRGKSQFKKGSDWWKFTIWNRMMGNQPIRIQLGKILWENLVGNVCGKFLYVPKIANVSIFCHFLVLLQAIKHHQTILFL